MLTDCPVGWGHEPRLAPRLLNAAVDSCFWPLYEVVDGRYRLTYQPEQGRSRRGVAPSAGALPHLFQPGNAAMLTEVQRRVDEEWDALLEKCSASA